MALNFWHADNTSVFFGVLVPAALYSTEPCFGEFEESIESFR